MGVDGCWCAPRSSKPVRGVKSLSGEFDSHMLPPEPRGRVPRGFLKNVDFPLDRTEGSSYNTTVRDVSRTTSYPGVAQLVARMVRDHEAVSSNLATRTKGQVLIGLAFFIAGVFPLHGTVHLPLSFPPTRRRTYSLLHCRRFHMTEENYNYRTNQTLLRNQFPGKGKLKIPVIPKF